MPPLLGVVIDYMPTEEGITIPPELLPDLQQAVDSLQQKIGQTQSKQ